MTNRDIKVVEKDKAAYTNLAILGYNSRDLEIYKGPSFTIRPN